MASTLGFEPEPHWWEESTLTTAPPLLPQVEGTSYESWPISKDENSGAVVYVGSSLTMHNSLFFVHKL